MRAWRTTAGITGASGNARAKCRRRGKRERWRLAGAHMEGGRRVMRGGHQWRRGVVGGLKVESDW